MPEWPSGDNPAVYEPPAPAKDEVESRTERKALLAAARIREGLTATENELEEVLARQDRNGGRSDILTGADRREMYSKSQVTDRVDRLLQGGEEPFFRKRVGWENGRHLITVYLSDDQVELRRSLEAIESDRLVIESAKYTQTEIDRRRDALHEHADELAAAGIELVGDSENEDGSEIEVWYMAPDPQSAEQIFLERFGEIVKPVWQGATGAHTFTAFPFGSWAIEENRLTVFYALGNNGERPGGCLAFETERAVVVSLQVLRPRGWRTLLGGFKPAQASVELERPLDTRVVIDDSTNQARPHWTEIACLDS